MAVMVAVQPAARAAQPATSDAAAFYLGGTCLCATVPTAQQALGLGDGYLSGAGQITGIGYPAGLLFALDSAIGVNGVNAHLEAIPDGVTITLAGVSQGAIVLNYVKQSLALRITPQRATTELSFVTFGDPMNSTGGIVARNPLLWLSVPPGLLPTPYATTEIVREYDGLADWPTRPTALSAINAVMGVAFVHPDYGDAADPTTPGTVKTVSTNAAGGVTTHYLVPTADLPVTQPLRDIGLDTSALDRWLRPQIDASYDRRPAVSTSSSGVADAVTSDATASPATARTTAAEEPAASPPTSKAEPPQSKISPVGRIRTALGLDANPTPDRPTRTRRAPNPSPLAAAVRALTPPPLRHRVRADVAAEAPSTTASSSATSAAGAPDTGTVEAPSKKSTTDRSDSRASDDPQPRQRKTPRTAG
ncbi:PE-PPE domain-containing protein [Mycolicibacterium canariasense]|nr:PE-PPE domain-containing protein [Mycolicibacterium canariasense]MCV7207471.1 PE-PPE domain-containing protein [Mycolicibacterium canariasense]